MIRYGSAPNSPAPNSPAPNKRQSGRKDKAARNAYQRDYMRKLRALNSGSPGRNP